MTSSHFPLPLAGVFEDDGRRFTLSQPFVYRDSEKDLVVEVPAGFRTDWNSVPGALWSWFAPWEYAEAGLIHDALYKNPSGFQSRSLRPPLTRAQCDDIHRRILDLKGCRWTKRQAIWLALRAGGGVAWNRHRAAENAALESSPPTGRKVGKQVNPGNH